MLLCYVMFTTWKIFYLVIWFQNTFHEFIHIKKYSMSLSKTSFFLLPCRDSHFKNKIANRLSVWEVAAIFSLFHCCLLRDIPARRRSPWPSLAPLERVMIRARAQEEGNRESVADGLQRRHISSRNGPHLESNGPLRQQRRTAPVWAADPVRSDYLELTPLLWGTFILL